jgi:hypothetical protein
MSVAAMLITVSGRGSWELVRQRAFRISRCRFNPAGDETSGIAYEGCKVCATINDRPMSALSEAPTASPTL